MKRSVCVFVAGLLALIWGVGASAAQPALGANDVMRLVSALTPGLEYHNGLNGSYADLNRDGSPELYVGALATNARRGHFFIFVFQDGEYRQIYHDEWHNNAYYSIELRQVRMVPGRFDTVAMISYSPGFGTGWRPIDQDIIWWDGHGYRVIWSGRVAGYESETPESVMELNSTVDFRLDQDGLFLDVVRVWRETIASGNVMLPSPAVTSYKWDPSTMTFLLD